MSEKSMYYYQIYDDQEENNFIKCTLEYDRIIALLKDYEREHDAYLNEDFVKFLHGLDEEAEIIKIEKIYY